MRISSADRSCFVWHAVLRGGLRPRPLSLGEDGFSLRDVGATTSPNVPYITIGTLAFVMLRFWRDIDKREFVAWATRGRRCIAWSTRRRSWSSFTLPGW